MKVLGIGRIEKTEENKKYFEINGMKMTGETITLGEPNGTQCEYVVFKGRTTPYGYVRDCGDHYIKAQWSRYDRIDKDTFKITHDVEDR